MRNRQFIGYTLVPLERNVKGRLFLIQGGGGGSAVPVALYIIPNVNKLVRTSK